VQPFIATLAMMFLARGLASMLSTTPERLDDDSPIRALATEWKIIDGPKINDLVTTPNVIIVICLLQSERVRALFNKRKTRTELTRKELVSA
jgi:simple sugar transport system permease protein